MSENSCETRLEKVGREENRVSQKGREEMKTLEQDEDECAEQSCEAVILRASSYRQNLCFDPIAWHQRSHIMICVFSGLQDELQGAGAAGRSSRGRDITLNAPEVRCQWNSTSSRPPPPWVTIEHPVAPAQTLWDTGRALQKVHADGDLVGVFYVDETKKPPAPPKKEVYISIEVRCETQPEERVAISGSDWQLGSWNPAESWYLNTSPSLYPIWKDRIPMPSPGGQFKIFIKNTVGNYVWEPLPCNRTWPRHGLTPDTEVKLTYGESGITTVSLGRAKESNKEADDGPGSGTSAPASRGPSAPVSRGTSAPGSPAKKSKGYVKSAQVVEDFFRENEFFGICEQVDMKSRGVTCIFAGQPTFGSSGGPFPRCQGSDVVCHLKRSQKHKKPVTLVFSCLERALQNGTEANHRPQGRPARP
eukprot:s693_g12.t1